MAAWKESKKYWSRKGKNWLSILSFPASRESGKQKRITYLLHKWVHWKKYIQGHQWAKEKEGHLEGSLLTQRNNRTTMNIWNQQTAHINVTHFHFSIHEHKPMFHISNQTRSIIDKLQMPKKSRNQKRKGKVYPVSSLKGSSPSYPGKYLTIWPLSTVCAESNSVSSNWIYIHLIQPYVKLHDLVRSCI